MPSTYQSPNSSLLKYVPVSEIETIQEIDNTVQQFIVHTDGCHTVRVMNCNLKSKNNKRS